MTNKLIEEALKKLAIEKTNFDKCINSLTIEELGNSFDSIKQIMLHSKDIDTAIRNILHRIDNKSISLMEELQK